MKRIYLLGSLLLLITTNCVIGPKAKDGELVITNSTVKGTQLKIQFERGKSWGTVVKLGHIKIRITPQIAVWVEDSSGIYKQTIYVTRCFGKQQWKSIKTEPDSTYRTSSLPFWMNKLKHTSIKVPTPGNPLPDAVSKATPRGSFELETYIDSTITRGRIWVEFNSSFDNNDTYKYDKSKLNPFNGQPALVYSADFSIDSLKFEPILFTYRGHSGEVGNDSKLYSTSDGITTANEIITSIKYSIVK
jgi:hypothetical protein